MKFIALLYCIFGFSLANGGIPKGFVCLKDVVPEIQQSARYSSEENFSGKKVAGYKSPQIVVTKEVAFKLKQINEELAKSGFELVVYDGYRPHKATEDFIAWAKDKTQTKKDYYFPMLSKEEIFERGFVSKRSGHSRGSTVDLTIIKKGQKVHKVKPIQRGKFIFLDDGTEDMGMHWDFFGEESWTESKLIAKEFLEKRKFLKEIMEKHGFKGITGEWWHFTLIDEPFKDKYFNFDII